MLTLLLANCMLEQLLQIVSVRQLTLYLAPLPTSSTLPSGLQVVKLLKPRTRRKNSLRFSNILNKFKQNGIQAVVCLSGHNNMGK
mmetsp:Transcript_12553/g.16237  ORF Transcript_12553/g.16237 Transcript_12553/m.16237 type:complete len:85 (+) Transcript_12553:813-1067(+)